MNTYHFNEIMVGQEEHFSRTVTLQMENLFREITGDLNPLHRDDAYAREIGNGRFKSHVSFGMLTASLLSTLAGVFLPGEYSLIHSIDKLSFKNPVYVGDTLTVSGKVMEKIESLQLLLLSASIVNQDQKIVLKAEMKIMVQQ